MYIFKSKSFERVKGYWRSKQYKTAISVLFDRLPNITYPLREEHNGILHERGEPSYNALLKKATEKYDHYNDIRNWKNVVWRELFHFIGAMFALIIPASLYYIARYFTNNLWVSVAFFMLIWAPHMLFNWKKELVDDPRFDGQFFIKNILDLLFWHLPGILFLAYHLFN